MGWSAVWCSGVGHVTWFTYFLDAAGCGVVFVLQGTPKLLVGRLLCLYAVTFVRLCFLSCEQEEALRLQSKCNVTLAKLEREAAEVDGLKQGLNRRHRQAEKDASEFAAEKSTFARWVTRSHNSWYLYFVVPLFRV